ncbi:MAG: short-chain-enoyl-CoA hydratase [Clostridiaceae bacterium]
MEYVILEKKDHIGIITLNRPEALNALNEQILTELGEAVDEVENNEDIYVAIITGSGKSFVAGADISRMKDFNVVQGKQFGLFGNRVFLKIENMTKPVIAAVNGFALGGGCELACSCDIRIASEKAIFGQPEVGLGITPGFGGTQRLQRIVGASKAKELIFTARNIKAEEALSIGLVSYVVPKDDVLQKAIDLGNEIAKNAQIAVRQSKSAMNAGIQVDINTAINIEAEAFGACFSTEDQKSAMEAFVEKRKFNSFVNR